MCKMHIYTGLRQLESDTTRGMGDLPGHKLKTDAATWRDRHVTLLEKPFASNTPADSHAFHCRPGARLRKRKFRFHRPNEKFFYGGPDPRVRFGHRQRHTL